MKTLFVVISFLSAYLLFQVQPIISKYFLPFFGGSSSVWIVTVLTFQILLVFGYIYGMFLGKKNLKLQILVHFLIVCLVAVYQRIKGSDWSSYITPGVEEINQIINLNPAWGLALGIVGSVGFIYLILSSTTNIIQSWYAIKYKNKSPYFLYRASNLGSFAGLLAYPILVEPYLTTTQQGNLFFYVFILYIALLLIISLSLLKLSSKLIQTGFLGKKPIPKSYLIWIGLSALTSAVMLAVSQSITQGVASYPLLWILPLALYLLSYVIGFRDIGGVDKFYLKLAYASTVIAVVYRVLENLGINQLIVQILVYNLFLVSAGIVIHNYLYKIKPAANYLTNFYLSLSVGGAIGGIVVGVAAPLLFLDYWEFDIALILTVYIITQIIQYKFNPVGNSQKQISFQSKFKIYQTLVMTILLVVSIMFSSKNITFQTRNFYGTLKVSDYPEHRDLTNGRILHGMQLLNDDRKHVPVSYYSKNSGFGILMDKLVNKKQSLNIGAVGLGVGTIASYCDENTKITFYEINPEVLSVAQKYFDFLEKCSETVVKLGDGRLMLAEENDKGLPLYNLLIIDAFTDDSIPVHLVTKEAFEIYSKRITPDGVIAVHVSNRYLDLAKPIKKIANEMKLSMVDIQDRNPSFDYSNTSDWILLSKDPEMLNFDLPKNTNYRKLEDIKDTSLWTDDFSSILPIIKFNP